MERRRGLGVGGRILAATVVLLVLAGAGIEWLSSRAIEAVIVGRTRSDLATRLSLVEDAIAAEAPAVAARRTTWDEAADALGARASARVTIVAPDGTVVGDSEVAASDLPHLENHAHRDEIAQAIAEGEGAALRMSPSIHIRMLYVARRYPRPADGIVVVRIAVPLAELDEALASSRRLLLLGGALAIAAAAAAAAWITRRLSRPLREVERTALAMAGGDLGARAPTSGADEVSRLGQALNRLAEELSRTIVALSQERDLLASILDGMVEGVLVVDGAGRVVLANRALRELAPGAVEDGRGALETFRSPGLDDALREAGERDEPVVREIELGVRSPRRLLVRAAGLGPPGTDRRIAVLRDVTDLRRLETIRTDFVANVSHELRTPVTAIGTAAETLLAGAIRDPGHAAEFVEMIDRQARRLRQLVDDLLDLAKIEAKDFRLETTVGPLSPVARRAVAALAEPARQRGISLTVAVDDELSARFDPGALDQVVSNLLDNAVKYSTSGAHVTIRGAERGEVVELVVEDDGPGIPPQHVERIFERFYRVDPGRSRAVGGTGLGLAIVKHLVERMEGRVQVDSKLGQGTRFSVLLPRR